MWEEGKLDFQPLAHTTDNDVVYWLAVFRVPRDDAIPSGREAGHCDGETLMVVMRAAATPHQPDHCLRAIAARNRGNIRVADRHHRAEIAPRETRPVDQLQETAKRFLRLMHPLG